MEILSHFRTIEELTKTLSREQGLLSEMFEKRKLMKFPQGLALELVGGNEARLRKLLDYGVLVETGNTIEIESDYLNFFEEVLNVNEEISVLSVQECINTLKEHIGYFLQETNTNRKAGYQDSVRQLLKKTGFRTLKNVVDLKRNMDNAYKQEPNYIIKKKKLARQKSPKTRRNSKTLTPPLTDPRKPLTKNCDCSKIRKPKMQLSGIRNSMPRCLNLMNSRKQNWQERA